MKSLFAPFLVLALVAASPAGSPTPAPTPTMDAHAYDDPAMHFEAPADYYLAGKQHVDSTKLEKATVVAIWVKFPGAGNQRTLTITLEPYEGRNVTGYEVYTENSLREQIDGVFVGGKQPMTLSNGMPAIFMSITSGSGFNSQKIYQVIWFDGLRGVSIAIHGRLGELTEDEAKAAFKTASATIYPRGRL